MLTPARDAAPEVIAEDYLRQSAAARGLAIADLEYAHQDSSYVTRHNGVSHQFFQQQVDGLPVTRAIAQVNVLPDGRVLSATNAFHANAQARASAQEPALSSAQMLVRVAAHFGIDRFNVPLPESAPTGRQQSVRYPGGLLSESPIDMSLVYEPVGAELRLAWRVVVDRYRSHQEHLDLRFDALTGDLLAQDNWVNDLDEPDAASSAATAASYSAEYRVFGLGVESPGHPGASHDLATNPAEANASPSGWNDTRSNPPAGAPEALHTRGNNVRAQWDLSGSNTDADANRPLGVWDAGSQTLRFDFPWVESEEPATATNRVASAVNLFYWNNIIHDVLWQYGFDEPSGNFQQNNFGRGGAGNDAVRADALDGSGTNNANFSTPGDGSPGRMQMFRWTSPGGLQVASPYVATYQSPVPGDWGGSFTSLSGDVVPVQGPTTGPLGCEGPYANAAAVSGKIALVKRGSCEFGLKALTAQQNGAIGVIIYNNDGTNAGAGMSAGSSGGSVTIPVMGLLGNQDGDALATAAAGGTVSVTMASKLYPDRDSDFDVGIMTHEYGHGVSNRLTGGTATGCLFGDEQAGEGWSDFYGLMLSMTPAVCSIPRGVGTYPSFEAPDGRGIRRYPYTPDMDVNPFTFADVSNTAQTVPHGVGSVWATMLWDMSCKLMDRYGYEADVYSGDGGNGLAMQLVTDGLKLQGCGPTFVMARNGILAADAAMVAADPAHLSNKCILWHAFARRGLGNAASSGSVNSRTDQTPDFTVPAECANFQVQVNVTGAGTVNPAGSPVSAAYEEVLGFTLTPAAGGTIASATGCEGTLAGNTFTTLPIVRNCTIDVVFDGVPLPDAIFADGFEEPVTP